MEIKKTPQGFEVDGITFDTRDVAERYIESLKHQEKADTSWLDEKIDYKFDPNVRNSSFRIFIENLAQKNSLNLTQVAERIGVKRQTLYNWMDARVIPDPGNIEKICRAFSVSRNEVTLAAVDNFANAYPEIAERLRGGISDGMQLSLILKTLAIELGPLDIAPAGGHVTTVIQWKRHKIFLTHRFGDYVTEILIRPDRGEGQSYEAHSYDELLKNLAHLKAVSLKQG